MQLRGTAVSVRDEGAGEPALFLHGIPDSHDVWGLLLRRLSQLRCVAADLPFAGASRTDDDFDFSFQNNASFVQELLDTVGITQPVHLVVHDAGAFFGLPWAALNRERVRTISVLNAPFHEEYRWHFWASVCRTRIVGELAMAALNRPLFGWEMRRGCESIDGDYIAVSYDKISASMKRQVLRLYRTLDPSTFRPWQRQLPDLGRRVPTRVFWGMKDPYVSRRFADGFGAPVHEFPQSGHWPQLDAPRALGDALRAHMQLDGTPS